MAYGTGGREPEALSARVPPLLLQPLVKNVVRHGIMPREAGGRVRFVKTKDIEWVEATGDHVRLHTGEKTHLFRKTMKEMEQDLDTHQFLHIHRSTIVNVDCLQEMRLYGSNNEYVIVLTDGTERKLSRTYRDKVADFFDGAL